MSHTDRKTSKGNEYAYRIYDCTQEKFYVTLIEKYRKGNEYAYIEYLNWTQRKILWYTLIENIKNGYRYQIY